MKEIGQPITTSLVELKYVKPKGRSKGTKGKKFKSNEAKSLTSTKCNPSAFEYVKSMDEQQSQSSVGMKKLTPKRKDNSFLYQTEIPDFLHPLVLEVEDVLMDRNCGFRYIPRQFDEFEATFADIRKQVLLDLDKNWNVHRTCLNEEC